MVRISVELFFLQYFSNQSEQAILRWPLEQMGTLEPSMVKGAILGRPRSSAHLFLFIFFNDFIYFREEEEEREVDRDR